MIVTCTKCQTQYALPAAAIGSEGRKVKCASCGNVWHQAQLPEETTAKLNKEPERIESVPKGGNLPALRKEKRAGLGLKVAAAVFLIGAIFLGLIATHVGGLDKALGMKAIEGLAFSNFTVEKQLVENRLEFTVKGDIVNESDAIQKLPDITMRVMTEGGREMDRLIFEPPQENLLAGETLHIEPKIEGVPGNADTIVLDIGTGWEMMFR